MVLHDLLRKFREDAAKSPYRVKAGGKGVIVWEITDGRWLEVATFRRRADADMFVLAAELDRAGLFE